MAVKAATKQTSAGNDDQAPVVLGGQAVEDPKHDASDARGERRIVDGFGFL